MVIEFKQSTANKEPDKITKFRELQTVKQLAQ
jgi:hypothetical protein